MKTHILSLGMMLACASGIAHAQTWPAKPMHIILGQSAGGISDSTARLVAQRFTEVFKHPADRVLCFVTLPQRKAA